MAAQSHRPKLHRLEQSIVALERYARRDATPPDPRTLELIEELVAAYAELQAAFDTVLTQNAALAAAQEHYQALFDGAPEAYVVTDLLATIQEANATALALFHQPSRNFLVGLPLFVFIAAEDWPAFHELLARLRTGVEVRDYALQLAPRQRPAVPVCVTVVPARGPTGVPVGLRWLIRAGA
jgi:PAS domain S-box-containing protein